MKLTAKKFHTEGYTNSIEEAREQLKYWKGLSIVEKDGFIGMAEVNGESKEVTEALAISEAWRRSDVEVARRKAKTEAFDNELLECSRTGEMIARKDAIVVGSSVFAKSALSKEEAEFLGIEIEVSKPRNLHNPTKKQSAFDYIKNGRRGGYKGY